MNGKRDIRLGNLREGVGKEGTNPDCNIRSHFLEMQTVTGWSCYCDMTRIMLYFYGSPFSLIMGKQI